MTTTMAAKGGDQSDDGGKERRNKNGEHCELLSPKECMNPNADEYRPGEKSRFGQDVYLPYSGRFKAHARARFLSPGIIFSAKGMIMTSHILRP
ncbi:hypothetical protein L6452_32188 [Arctium lappa]|uniref:Uncharacterized protein n=1 Tax=Arctium lappa TaxID=4217 RepID=A0ACB8Z3Y2_ARCLA|nr:hypothetical protein L6452_32188 [Arctium lappa]